MTRFLTLSNIVCIILVIMGIGVADQGFRKQNLQGDGFRKRMLALEFATNQSRVTDLTKREPGESSSVDHRKDLLGELQQDSTLAIPGYWLYFGLLNAFLYARKLFESKIWLLAVPVVISITALADYYENMSAVSALTLQTGATGIYPAAVVKWIGLSVACGLLGAGFLLSKSRFAHAAGAAYFVASLLIASFSIFKPEWTDIGMGLFGISISASGIAIPAIVHVRTSTPLGS